MTKKSKFSEWEQRTGWGRAASRSGGDASPDTQISTKTMLAKLEEQTELRESSGRVQVQGDGGKNYP